MLSFGATAADAASVIGLSISVGGRKDDSTAMANSTKLIPMSSISVCVLFLRSYLNGMRNPFLEWVGSQTKIRPTVFGANRTDVRPKASFHLSVQPEG